MHFCYNSNKIAGGRLTEEQIEAIFDISSFIPKSDEDDNDKHYLIDICLHSEDINEDICNQLLDFEIRED